MSTETLSRNLAYWIVLAGLGIALLAATVPHYSAGFHLELPVLIVMLLPFVAYGALALSLKQTSLIVAGGLLLAVCLVLLAQERFMAFDGYRDMRIYWVPLLAAAVILPIAYWIGGKHQAG